MGELHLEVIKERIVSEYKIKVELGPMQIAYRETLAATVKDSHSIHQKIGMYEYQMK
jgi:elongation factor G